VKNIEQKPGDHHDRAAETEKAEGWRDSDRVFYNRLWKNWLDAAVQCIAGRLCRGLQLVALTMKVP